MDDKIYNIKIIGNEITDITIIADTFYTNDKHYAFYRNLELIACFPIDRTVIYSITKAFGTTKLP